MFLFNSGSVNNTNGRDACTLALWLTLRLDENGLTVRRCVVLGPVVSGLAVLDQGERDRLIVSPAAQVAACCNDELAALHPVRHCQIVPVCGLPVVAGSELVAVR